MNDTRAQINHYFVVTLLCINRDDRHNKDLCYAMLCYDMLCYVTFCYNIYIRLCYVILCYVMLCYAMLSYVMLCYAMLCYVMRHVQADLVKLDKQALQLSYETQIYYLLRCLVHV